MTNKKSATLLIMSLGLILITSWVLLHIYYSQPDSSLEADLLTLEEIKNLKEKTITPTDKDIVSSETFFSKWEKASTEYARSHSNSKIDSIYQKIIIHILNSDKINKFNGIRDPHYIVLPSEVLVCICDTIDQQTQKDNQRKGITPICLPGYKIVASGYQIPHIVSDKSVLYDFPSIHNELKKYLNEIKEEEERNAKINHLRKYIPVEYFTWRKYFNIVSYPEITRICIYKHGIGVYTHISLDQGLDFFLPNGSDKIEITGGWIV